MPTTALIVGGIGTAVSAGSSIAGAASAKKAAKAQQAQLAQLGNMSAAQAAEIFGSPVEFEAPEYTPLEQEDPGYANIISRILQGARQNLGAASGLSGGINKEISKATRERISGWDPSFMGALSTLQGTRNETLQGHLPYEDALAITADTSRLQADLGNAGGSTPQVARDLGMKRLDLMTNIGPNLTASIVNILNGVDPVARHSLPQDYLISPREGVPMAIQDRQFGSTFNMESQLTGAYLDAAPNPAAQGLFNMQAFQAGMGTPGAGSGAAAMQSVGNAFSALGSINWAALRPQQQAPSSQFAQNPYIGNAGYVPNYYNPQGQYNPGGAASVPWAMGA
jgi:hypothetical protein